MLEVQDLTKKYGKVIAVDQVSFKVPDGKVGILLGPNGAGKSTIIKSIAGLVRFKGSVKIQDKPSNSIEAKKVFAYVPEIPSMFEALTVREHFEYIKRAYNVNVTDDELNRLMERFELIDKQDKLGNELSKGMMQKVSICCALLIKPEVIMLDEPMVGLDPAAIKELKIVVDELKQSNATILISTHMLEMVKDLWDIMFVMSKGKVIGQYNKDEVDAQAQDIETLFFNITGGEK
ncbi:ABC transporter ATP-binding protein [Anaerosacchariphilus polymeriproducens]|uniref:ABC transporter ATP-binding protein n=1 Tax=Anaerosacchariphilus polymeriproducens TaxID=1812858 RepID=A0A371AUN7_9FIRM|nr:ABC transporter ATP-binding protein [Anaerosacchariphilus polymeriproducens]RDU23277.1 ABC transporter ATP-binding protein [Anaerosacchariphilus polymeriproducens]